MAACAAPVKFDHVVVYVCDSSGCSVGQGGPGPLRRTKSVGSLIDAFGRARMSRHRPLSGCDEVSRCCGGGTALRGSYSYADVGSQLSIDFQRSCLGGSVTFFLSNN